MTEGGPERQFENEVFPAELEEIRRRRGNVGDPRPLPREGGRPSTNHDLMGLAFSGGGIRSAAFSLGVAQHLIASGGFRKVDYVSTVSGGGYAGSCLSALMRGEGHGERLLVDREGGREPPALNHVRNRSNYLLSSGLLNHLRLPAVVLAGTFHTLLLLLPPLVLLVFLTELFFELTGHFLIDARHWLALVGVAPLLLALIARPLRTGRGSWSDRDRATRRLGGWLLLAVVSVVAIPALKWLGAAVNYDAAWAFNQLGKLLQDQRGLGVRSWLLWAGIGAGLALIFGAAALRAKLVLLLVGALGPMFLLSVYVLACMYAIKSPVSKDEEGALRKAIDEFRGVYAPPGGSMDPVSPGPEAATVERLVGDLLRTKRVHLRDYKIQWKTLREDDSLVLDRLTAAPWWLTLLTQDYSPRLHVRFEADWWSAIGLSKGAPRLIVIDELRLLGGHAEWWFYAGGLLLWLYNCFCVNVNRISMHSFYRDRLSRAFLLRPEGPDGAAPVASADDLPLSQLGGPFSAAPYHLINTALNLHGSDISQLRERKTSPFLLAQRFCGCEFTGYCKTESLEAMDPGLNLGAAMAISAAAASPNMGTIAVRPLTFLLALLNIRLNYWLPHPNRVERRSWRHRLLYSRLGLLYLLAEALGNVDERAAFINCSDGGHIENLGAYELLKRRCHTIVCVDGEADPSFHFPAFATLQRYAEIDFGARIEMDFKALYPGQDGISAAHHAVGRIIYSEGEIATLIYLKLSYTGDEAEYLRFYKRRSPAFPHESTADQFFGETQFEVYRALGAHIAAGAFADDRGKGSNG